MTLLIGLLTLAGAYLIGSVPFAVVISRLMGLQDPRQFGSGNPGATNVLRSGNKLAAILTLVGDAAKGWVAVAAASFLATRHNLPPLVVALAALLVVLGHMYPVFLRFRGGKGVATAVGVLLAVHPGLALATIATWLIVARATRYSSLAALVAAIFAPLYYLLGNKVAWTTVPSLVFALFAISVLVIARHGANISRLLQGKESRIGASQQDASRASRRRQ